LSDQGAFLSRLSPDLRKLYDGAEKLADESLYKKALLVLKKIHKYLPDDDFLNNRIHEMETLGREVEGPVAEGSHILTKIETGPEAVFKELFRELEIDEHQPTDEIEGIEMALSAIENLDRERFKRVALDGALLAGVSNNWRYSLRLTEKLIDVSEENFQIQLWKLRCLVELESFPEAVALFTSIRWPQEALLHANFLVGLSYEGLGVRDQAKLRFEAVHKVDPSYRKVAQKLLNY
jgi:tetratricopeptide (TPR) repeat protein